jgi:hypothetical protein
MDVLHLHTSEINQRFRLLSYQNFPRISTICPEILVDGKMGDLVYMELSGFMDFGHLARLSHAFAGFHVLTGRLCKALEGRR